MGKCSFEAKLKREIKQYNTDKRIGKGKAEAIARYHALKKKDTIALTDWSYRSKIFNDEVRSIRQKQERSATTIQSMTTAIHKVHGINKTMNKIPVKDTYKPIERKPRTIFEKPNRPILKLHSDN